ncbi:MAG: sugar ABC transporter substrate-binding protein [Butyrivibrio sp.]|uniref:sugar ABC transporter substrate-binding protein n=1 Tax=Butyrivibrio sp. TaxID=28121 RepID=UPI001EB663FE|nr:extracellular solute-binding protein [Butyrivibrio sp.]MBE5841016.1 sugar ABC transporter substrate-binding protein [Butyrivibrio sp.]MCR4756293.1 extracellular solute-binding protein [Butyrivibrio sp.]
MKARIRIFSVILLLCTLVGTLIYAHLGQSVFEDRSFFEKKKTTVRIWYTDDALTPYLQSRAVAYSESSKKVRIEPVLVSGLEYLENINKASLEDDNYPDLFIITNDSLEKAYLAGLALEIDNGAAYLNPEVFPAAAINSVTYKDKLIAYPFYFETSSLIYNKTYLDDMARENIAAEIDKANGEAAQEEVDASSESASTTDTEASSEEVVDEEISQEQIDQYVKDSIPHSIADILKFSLSYNVPDGVDSIFKWDVTDIFYNYFFVGNYMNVGGEAGDDVAQIDIYNTDTISCMKIYQLLNQFFAIDADDIDYNKVTDDFINGKIVFTVATTDILAKIQAAQASGDCKYEFAVAEIPALSQKFSTRTMSVTQCIVVNGYSEHPSEANSFAKYLLNDDSGDIYKLGGKVAAHSGVNYDDSNLDTFVKVYSNSVPMPKTIETSNLWMQLEIAFTDIWNGGDCNSILKEVSENIMTQVTGDAYTEETLPDPDDGSITEGLTEESD